jgi:predicted lipid-binding transport protein (Tim44 family)
MVLMRPILEFSGVERLMTMILSDVVLKTWLSGAFFSGIAVGVILTFISLIRQFTEYQSFAATQAAAAQSAAAAAQSAAQQEAATARAGATTANPGVNQAFTTAQTATAQSADAATAAAAAQAAAAAHVEPTPADSKVLSREVITNDDLLRREIESLVSRYPLFVALLLE